MIQRAIWIWVSQRMRVSDGSCLAYQISSESILFRKKWIAKYWAMRETKNPSFFYRLIDHPRFVKEQPATILIDRREVIPVGFDN